MAFYTYIILFFAGAFLANGVPHFVNGVSGRKFPTPFAHPSGKGLSSPIVNMLWGLGNFIVGYILLLLVGPVNLGFSFESLALFLGMFLVSLQLAWHFGSLNLH
jgi:hypothetical protein